MGLIRSKCVCGKEYWIETNSKHSCRRDRKRVFDQELEVKYKGCGGAFRCRNCKRPVDESVPGAEFE